MSVIIMLACIVTGWAISQPIIAIKRYLRGLNIINKR